MKIGQNTVKRVVVILLVSFCLTALNSMAFAAQTGAKDHTVKGILEPHKGQLVLRDMTSGIRYHLAGQDLTAQRGKMVKVNGPISEDTAGIKTINVTKFEVIKAK